MRIRSAVWGLAFLALGGTIACLAGLGVPAESWTAVRSPSAPPSEVSPVPLPAALAPGEAIAELRRRGAQVRPWTAAPRSGPNGVACGVDDGVVMSRGATGVRWAKPAQVNGQFALRLASFEALAQEVAAETLSTPIARIETLGAYVCRSVKGTAGSPSEHASGNAVDVSAFVLKDGRRITVARHFVRGGGATATPSERFLRRLTEKVRQQGTFGTVLTPDYDARHANHLHLDGRRWFGGWF